LFYSIKDDLANVSYLDKLKDAFGQKVRWQENTRKCGDLWEDALNWILYK
jgi:hypothetical protein